LPGFRFDRLINEQGDRRAGLHYAGAFSDTGTALSAAGRISNSRTSELHVGHHDAAGSTSARQLRCYHMPRLFSITALLQPNGCDSSALLKLFTTYTITA